MNDGSDAGILRADHLSATKVDTDMAAIVLEHQIPWLRSRGAFELTRSSNGRRSACRTHAGLPIDILHETRTVPSARRIATPNVGRSFISQGNVYDVLAQLVWRDRGDVVGNLPRYSGRTMASDESCVVLDDSSIGEEELLVSEVSSGHA